MITSPDGKGVIVLGCLQNPEAIYKMTSDIFGDLQWTKLQQTLKYPRFDRPVISYINESLVSCH